MRGSPVCLAHIKEIQIKSVSDKEGEKSLSQACPANQLGLTLS